MLWFVLDGIPVNDPSSEAFFGCSKPTSGVEIPEAGADFYEAKDVPHGEVRAFWYHSRTTGRPRRAFVYTPPGSAEERLATAVKRMHEALDQAGVRHVVFESVGTAHEWQTWRRSLNDFAPRLFQRD